MRIVAGKYGSRLIKAPKGRIIRPTSDKIRGAVFNMLRARNAVEDAHVIDGFCGTGALGIEALSQGATFCLFIDNNRTSLDLARANAKSLRIGAEAAFLLKDIMKLPPRQNAEAATLLFLDPPYNKNLALPALKNFREQNWLAPSCICVLETEKNLQIENFEIIGEKIYGDTKITLLSAQ